MNVAFLGLGGNIGERLENLRKTIIALSEGCGEVIERSRIYETEAWGSDSEKKFLNQVVQLNTLLPVEDLLQKILQIELQLGRTRNGRQNSDRTVDIDILLYNSDVINLFNLYIPHPRLHLRKFVLVPLCEIAPALIHPTLKKSIYEILKSCEDKLEVKQIN